LISMTELDAAWTEFERINESERVGDVCDLIVGHFLFLLEAI